MKNTTKEEILKSIEILSDLRAKYDCFDEKEKLFYHALSLGIEGIKRLEQEPKAEPNKCEYHTYHTECIWNDGEDSRCPSTCSQYRDGWNDAIDYVYKNGKGYQPGHRDNSNNKSYSRTADITEEDKKLKKEFLDLVGSLPQKIKVKK